MSTGDPVCPTCGGWSVNCKHPIPGPTSLETYELVHGDKEDTTSKEARLDELFQSFRKRLENLTSKLAIDESIDQLLCDARQIYPDYPNISTSKPVSD